MKKTIFAFAIVGSMFLVSCGTEEENSENKGTEQSTDETEDEGVSTESVLVGTWQQTGLDMGVEIPDEEKEMFDKTTKETVDNTKYVFGEDGSLKISTWMLGRIIESDLTYSIDGETLMTSQDGEDLTFNFTVSGSELVILQKNPEATITMTFNRE